MRLRFDEQHVKDVPEQSGIFTLWDQQDLVYIGRTAPRSNLQADLKHALKMAMADDMLATHFSYEETVSPKTRASEELRAYFENWGRLPRYNGVSTSAARVEAALLRAR